MQNLEAVQAPAMTHVEFRPAEILRTHVMQSTATKQCGKISDPRKRSLGSLRLKIHDKALRVWHETAVPWGEHQVLLFSNPS